MTALDIRQDDLEGQAVRSLLALHLAGMHANSPACHVNALDLTGLRQPNVTVWSAWKGASLAGIGGLKRVDAETAEVKSMRTHPDHLREGVGAALLEHIISTARDLGARRLSLETGRSPAFEPALAMYRRRGFVVGPAFADYSPGDFSLFLHLAL